MTSSDTIYKSFISIYFSERPGQKNRQIKQKLNITDVSSNIIKAGNISNITQKKHLIYILKIVNWNWNAHLVISNLISH